MQQEEGHTYMIMRYVGGERDLHMHFLIRTLEHLHILSDLLWNYIDIGPGPRLAGTPMSGWVNGSRAGLACSGEETCGVGWRSSPCSRGSKLGSHKGILAQTHYSLPLGGHGEVLQNPYSIYRVHRYLLQHIILVCSKELE